MGSSHQIPDEEGLDGDVRDSSGSCYEISLKYRRIKAFKVEFSVAYLHAFRENKQATYLLLSLISYLSKPSLSDPGAAVSAAEVTATTVTDASSLSAT